MSGSQQGGTAEHSLPDLPAALIDRPRLRARLDEVMSRPLLSVTGPAGTGKTVLAAQWCWQSGVPVAWVRLGRDDNDPDRLLARLVDSLGALTGHDTTLGLEAVSVDTDRPSPQVIDRLTRMLTDTEPSVLAVDGLRASGPLAVYADLAIAVEMAPNCGVHVLTVSRCTLPSWLNPFQFSGTIPVVGAADLELDAAETAAIVKAYSGRSIAGGTAAELTRRIEGWMVGTVIAALTHPGGEPSAAELLDSASEEIEDYVANEVLGHLPSDVHSFLLTTSPVSGLTAALCDRLTDRTDSHDVLRTMRLHGLPIRRLQSATRTYRYNEWFREVIDTRFRRQDARARATTLGLARDWYTEHEQPLDAAECCARLGDWAGLARAVSSHPLEYLEIHDVHRLARLFEAVPRQLRRTNFQLGIEAATAEMRAGRVAAAFSTLAALPSSTSRQRMHADLIRSNSVFWVDNPMIPLAAAEAVIAACDRSGDDESWGGTADPIVVDAYRTVATSNALAACAFDGRWDEGRGHLVDLQPTTATRVGAALLLHRRASRAMFLTLAGDVREGRAEANAGLRLATESHLLRHPVAGPIHYAVGEVQRISGSLAQARPSLESSLELARLNDRRNLVAIVLASLANLLVDLGDPAEALALLDGHRAEINPQLPAVPAALLAAAEARGQLATGDHHNALDVLGRAPVVSATAALRAVAALAVGDIAGARRSIERWPDESTATSVIRRAAAEALLLDATGDSRAAQSAMRTALRSADDHLVQPIAELGAPAARLLRRVARHDRDRRVARLAARIQASIATADAAVARLTARELAVLHHLARGLSLPAVAKELLMSVNTVKTHVKAIYRKLGATSRAEALETWQAARKPDPAPADRWV